MPSIKINTVLYSCLISYVPCGFAVEQLTTSDNCLLEKIKQADGATPVAQIKAQCFAEEIEVQQRSGAISQRIIQEKTIEFDPYVITPHKMNYILPISFTDSLNKDSYREVDDWAENITDIEAKFQLSIKVPLNFNPLLTKGDALYFGMTLKSWWQVYADHISKPFRETNYQPEIFYLAPLDWHPYGSNTGFIIGAEHQSNGRSQILSRSWNRLYTGLMVETENFALLFSPWWRLPEKEKRFDSDPSGDDNPDISHYMGHFELLMGYTFDELEFTVQIRENFARHHGAIELGFTFPFWGRLKGYVQYFNGYGDSLIDYNHKQQRIGIGIALTDML